MDRVALLTPYARPIPGGISSFIDGLSSTLTGEGYEVAVFAAEGGTDRDRSDLGTGRSLVKRSVKALSEHRPDIVHAHGHSTCLKAGLLYKRDHQSVRVVFSFHTTRIPSFPHLLRSLLSRADIVTFVSAEQLAYLREALKLGGDLRILRPATELAAVDLAISGREWLTARGMHEAYPILTFAGPLEYPRKVQGVIDLVRSLRIVRESYPAVKLIIIGDGTLRPLVDAAAADADGAVTVTGYLGDPRPIVAASDLYCHASYQEGLPIALLEAMSVGVPCLASSVGGIPEVINGDNGVLVGSGPERIAEAIRRLSADPDARGRMGRLARDTIEKHFTWKARVQQIRSLYGMT